ncbi:hypothetical protein T492DRAFT_896733 [Pavlovales sp. CCMP2436]|nr:hypothetical protein T492DRAFT_896733 [Pavlovales sp. CCMP2436]
MSKDELLKLSVSWARADVRNRTVEAPGQALMEWACGVCTLMNGSHRRRCTACSCPCPHTVLPPTGPPMRKRSLESAVERKPSDSAVQESTALPLGPAVEREPSTATQQLDGRANQPTAEHAPAVQQPAKHALAPASKRPHKPAQRKPSIKRASPLGGLPARPLDNRPKWDPPLDAEVGAWDMQRSAALCNTVSEQRGYDRYGRRHPLPSAPGAARAGAPAAEQAPPNESRARLRERASLAALRLEQEQPMSREEQRALQCALQNSRSIQSLRAPRDGVRDAPTFHPTEAEFLKPLEYLRHLHAVAGEAGICRVVPPERFRVRAAGASGAGDAAAAAAELAHAAAMFADELSISTRRMPLHLLQEGRPFQVRF